MWVLSRRERLGKSDHKSKQRGSQRAYENRTVSRWKATHRDSRRQQKILKSEREVRAAIVAKVGKSEGRVLGWESTM
jgi:hypothetical protein